MSMDGFTVIFAEMTRIQEKANELIDLINTDSIDETTITTLRMLENCIQQKIDPDHSHHDVVTYILDSAQASLATVSTQTTEPVATIKTLLTHNPVNRATPGRRMNHKRVYKSQLAGASLDCYSVEEDLTVKRSSHYLDKRFRCAVCDYRAHRKDMVQMHMKVHTGEKPYKCQLCDYVSAYKNDVVKHVRIHSGEKPYKCAVCNQTFRQPGGLRVHMRTHTGQKPYKCSLCDMRSAQQSGIKTHIRLVHLREQPYKCQYCSYACGVSSSLKEHEMRHTGEKPFDCSLEGCSYRASTRKAVKAHERSHDRNRKIIELIEIPETGDKSCELCDHGISHETNGEDSYKCKNCDYIATKCYKLFQHKQECSEMVTTSN